jgi:hemerythrin-like domain-containing protein
MDEQRREFLLAITSGATLIGCGAVLAGREPERPRAGRAEVTPGEDLMQEHGLLERILLIYGEAAARIERRAEIDRAVVTGAAETVRRFVEQYHEQLEERHLFPRLEAAGVERELVAVLRRQHQRGRDLTAEILRLEPGPKLADALRRFGRMYRPHAAREDTVLFPAFRRLLDGAAYRELGERFEEEEHALLGARGFAGAVGEVAQLEEALGIADLAAFTP